MVKLRLKRMGRTHRPYYRINAMDQRSARDSRPIEQLGQYDPLEKDDQKQITIKEDRVRYWISVGAQPTETVANLLKKVGIDPTPGAKQSA
jgi:small subunit ribosomal protein S16